VAERGRPREFDLDVALDAAIEVFWRQGYEGTTLDDLTRAMGINRPSLYAACGNKEETFMRAVARYAQVDMAHVDEALGQPTARAVAKHFVRSNVLAITDPSKPPGCLSIQGGSRVQQPTNASSTSSTPAVPLAKRASLNASHAQSAKGTCLTPRTRQSLRSTSTPSPAGLQSKPPVERRALPWQGWPNEL
jgi:AcrR family transcriptional regulator